ncbi:MAG: acyl-CoA dehydrogenase family protein [Acidimicrobiia bacterium]|nr:acyl-CoA dehydrogenase family protein [Acidimicrobiia bacterium]
MDFSLTEEQELLRDTARALLARECPTSLVRRHIEDPAVADPLSDRLRDLQALGAGDLTDLCLVLEETGAVAAPGTFFPTVGLLAPLLAATADEQVLPAVLAGEATGTVALAGADGTWVPNPDPAKTFVPEADRVDWVAVVSPGPTLTMSAARELPVRRVATVDPSRRLFEVDVSATTGPTVPLDPESLQGALEWAWIALAAEMVGTAGRMLEMAVRYARERIQFDVPIGSFQAVQHKLADVSLAVERARAAVHYAAMTFDDDDPDRHRAAHVAKAAAGNAARRAARDGIQVHGGIGFTWEHDLHLFIRRAYGSEHLLGTTSWHHDRLADVLL